MKTFEKNVARSFSMVKHDLIKLDLEIHTLRAENESLRKMVHQLIEKKSGKTIKARKSGITLVS